MGNIVCVDVQQSVPSTFEDLVSNCKEPKASSVDYDAAALASSLSNLKIWSVSQTTPSTPSSSVLSERGSSPDNDGKQPIEQDEQDHEIFIQPVAPEDSSSLALSASSCYIVLHTYRTARPLLSSPRIGSNVSDNPQEQRLQTRELWQSCEKALTPRGLSSSLAAPHQQIPPSIDMEEDSSSPKAIPSSFAFEIFCWNGKQAPSMVKATALAKGFELERVLYDAQIDPSSLFSSGTPRPLSSIVSTSKPSLGHVAPLSVEDSFELDFVRKCRLFRTITSISQGGDGRPRSAVPRSPFSSLCPSPLPSPSASSALRILPSPKSSFVSSFASSSSSIQLPPLSFSSAASSSASSSSSILAPVPPAERRISAGGSSVPRLNLGLGGVNDAIKPNNDDLMAVKRFRASPRDAPSSSSSPVINPTPSIPLSSSSSDAVAQPVISSSKPFKPSLNLSALSSSSSSSSSSSQPEQQQQPLPRGGSDVVMSEPSLSAPAVTSKIPSFSLNLSAVGANSSSSSSGHKRERSLGSTSVAISESPRIVFSESPTSVSSPNKSKPGIPRLGGLEASPSLSSSSGPRVPSLNLGFSIGNQQQSSLASPQAPADSLLSPLSAAGSFSSHTSGASDTPSSPLSSARSNSSALSSARSPHQIPALPSDSVPFRLDIKAIAESAERRAARAPPFSTQIFGSGGTLPAAASASLFGDMDLSHISEERGREMKLAVCLKICSKIDSYIYLGSDQVARNKELLEENGITHILNAAGMVCGNYFPQDFVYKTLYILDAPGEDITPLFYDIVDFVEQCRASGGSIFIHCHQGVSRSAALTIAYMMWRDSLTYEQAFDDVKSKRGVCSPNAGFIVQLLKWAKYLQSHRDFAQQFSSSSSRSSPSSIIQQHQPRLYRIAPFSSQYTAQVAPRAIEVNSSTNLSEVLDSRFTFVLQSVDRIFAWIGSDVSKLCSSSASVPIAPPPFQDDDDDDDEVADGARTLRAVSSSASLRSNPAVALLGNNAEIIAARRLRSAALHFARELNQYDPCGRLCATFEQVDQGAEPPEFARLLNASLPLTVSSSASPQYDADLNTLVSAVRTELLSAAATAAPPQSAHHHLPAGAFSAIPSIDNSNRMQQSRGVRFGDNNDQSGDDAPHLALQSAAIPSTPRGGGGSSSAFRFGQLPPFSSSASSSSAAAGARKEPAVKVMAELYEYPEFVSLESFDTQDLDTASVFVLHTWKQQQASSTITDHHVYVWVGSEFAEDDILAENGGNDESEMDAELGSEEADTLIREWGIKCANVFVEKCKRGAAVHRHHANFPVESLDSVQIHVIQSDQEPEAFWDPSIWTNG